MFIKKANEKLIHANDSDMEGNNSSNTNNEYVASNKNTNVST